MTFNLVKLASLAETRSDDAKIKAQFRRENRDWIRMSQDIALNLHYYMRKEQLTQRELAKKLGVSAVYINKLLKGSENLTLETISKIQKALGQQIITIEKPYL